MNVMTGPIITARLTLRVLVPAAPAPEDAALLQAYLLENRHHLAPWEPLRDDTYFSLAECEQRLLASRQSMEAGSALHFAVFITGAPDMIGICHFSNIVRGVFQACHLGYAIAEKHEGKGYMQEAVQAGIRHMFTQQGLHRVMANHLPDNVRSAGLLQKLGFEREGYARSYLKINGRWQDHVLNALLNPEN
ncbi:ribosomal protein S5-alanine N-acetyltransferase [Undibacterium terreum]|uniref:[Ribosomal protein uS5]-alanine N-acetyltransferase n=1 Tax=Undibacterium terreum TaxID=1224302 RepID=A0A916UNT5_9BURK|nr:ribosomal protein S5-alanine N-acetyltransferase [Undibacterium terreum]GGC79392.1 alanine acetyltransferase [Undibacterium terreum]